MEKVIFETEIIRCGCDAIETLPGSISINAPKVPEIKIHSKIKILSQ